MQPEIGESLPAARQVAGAGARWIRGHARDPMPYQQPLGRLGEPRQMPGLTDEAAVIPIPESAEKSARHCRAEGKRWRELHENRAALRPKASRFIEELTDQRASPNQSRLVRDGPRQLDRERESRRRALRPPGVSPPGVMAIERAVDFDARQRVRITLEMRALGRETMRQLPGDAPAGDADPDRDQRDARARGTFAPFLRASLRPMAIACLRLVTLRPDPLFNVPVLRRCIADFTVFCALLPYLAMLGSFQLPYHASDPYFRRNP